MKFKNKFKKKYNMMRSREEYRTNSRHYAVFYSREEYRTNSRHYAVFYSRGHQCGGIGINYQTHNTHAHAQLHVHTTQFLSVRIISVAGRLFAAGPSRDTHCLINTWQFSLALATAFSLFIRLWCSHDPG
jgi:hypothetical protein